MIKEKRNIASNGANIRAIATTDNNERFIEGYASVFNVASRQIVEYHDGRLVQFTEVIEPRAFDEVLANPDLNVIHTINHDQSKMVARTKSGTLQLTVDDIGLKYRFSVPNTTVGNDLYEMVQRGDLTESSFVFSVNEKNERWLKKPDGNLYRYISSMSNLFDTSTVTDGAYPNTKVQVARNLQEFIEPEQLEEQNAKSVDIDFDIYLLKQKRI